MGMGHTTLRVMVKTTAPDAINHLRNRQCWGQDWGTGTLGSYGQLVLPQLHHEERQLSRHCLSTHTYTKLGGYQRQPNRDQVTTYNV